VLQVHQIRLLAQRLFMQLVERLGQPAHLLVLDMVTVVLVQLVNSIPLAVLVTQVLS
jgi:DNA-binding IclR family transcriptional regulator